MAADYPGIDLRDHAALVRQLHGYLSAYSPQDWPDVQAVSGDRKAGALVHIFSRMMEIIIARLNRLPDKTFLAFLDKLGICLAPPRPARTALVFSLVKKAPKAYAEVPAGTQVAAEKSPDKYPLVFETEESLTAITPALVGAVSMCGADDKYSDHSALFATRDEESAETLFSGKSQIPHKLYIGDPVLFNYKKSKSIVIELECDKVSELAELQRFYAGDTFTRPMVNWFYVAKDGTETPLSLKKEPEQKRVYNTLRLTFGAIEAPAEYTLTGFEKTETDFIAEESTNRWIGMELIQPCDESDGVETTVQGLSVPPILSVSACVEDGTGIADQVPDAGFYENFPIDFTKDFRPFGERPKRFDTFYIGSAEVLSKQGSTVTIAVTPSAQEQSASSTIPDAVLVWEYWDGSAWKELGRSSWENQQISTMDVVAGQYEFTDGTKAFTAKDDASITFNKCPSIQKCKIGGVEDFWIRVRILSGGYGEEVKYLEFTENNEPVRIEKGIKEKYALNDKNDYEWVSLGSDKTVWSYVPATFTPPSISGMKLSCTAVALPVDQLLAFNAFQYTSISSSPFVPFIAAEEQKPALYLEFNENIADLPVTLFFPLSAVGYIPASGDDDPPPNLKWEYFNGSLWVQLTVEDRTSELTQREMVVFHPPSDCIPVPFYGKQSYWIRATLTKGTFPFQPSLLGIYTNAVWARNHVTSTDILLGSSTGLPDQTIKLPYGSILAGQIISIREDAITTVEKKAVEDERGAEAIDETRDLGGNITETWVRWKEVPHFYFSDPASRHYTIDRTSGTITFGDGRQGMIPPTAKNGIRCDRYLYGGGVRGNVKKRTLTKLRKAIPYIDKVTNPVGGEGGVNEETIEQVAVRGPRLIKTRDRAVTASDFEWIAHEASQQIARVKCLPVTDQRKQFKSGHVALMIIPTSDDDKPLPSAELVDEVRNYVLQRTAAHIAEPAPCPIHVMAPNYIKVDVSVDVCVISIGEGKLVENRIIGALRRFLHPLTGGPDGKGWEFGRNVYDAELYQLVEKIEGVDFVKNIFLNSTVAAYDIGVSKENRFTADYSFPSRSRLLFNNGDIVLMLAEAIHKGEESASLKARGFMEGDQVEIYTLVQDEQSKEWIKGNSLFLTLSSVQSISKDGKSASLTCIADESDVNFPAGSIVETSRKPVDRRVRSILTKALEKGEITEILIAIPLPKERFIVEHRDWPSYQKTAKVDYVIDETSAVYFEEDCLPYSGIHSITTSVQEQSPDTDSDSGAGDTPVVPASGSDSGSRYLVNIGSKGKNGHEIHDLSNSYPQCHIDKIPMRNRRMVKVLYEIRSELEAETYDFCAYCFGPRFSKQ